MFVCVTIMNSNVSKLCNLYIVMSITLVSCVMYVCQSSHSAVDSDSYSDTQSKLCDV